MPLAPTAVPCSRRCVNRFPCVSLLSPITRATLLLWKLANCLWKGMTRTVPFSDASPYNFRCSPGSSCHGAAGRAGLDGAGKGEGRFVIARRGAAGVAIVDPAE